MFNYYGPRYSDVKVEYKPKTTIEKLRNRESELLLRERALAKQVAEAREEQDLRKRIKALEMTIDGLHATLKRLAMTAATKGA